MEICCGAACDRELMQAELRVQGATEFVAYLETNIKEDVSTAVIEQMLFEYKVSKLGLHYGTSEQEG